ncbi:MerR family transcriptional regulator [Streptomyces lasalocidi]
MTDGITIGQAAAFAGVTVKTIRHYHQHGLIDEPRRDTSGYRRYGSADLLRLVQVRTLAGAGVPLAEITAILDADPDRFAAALLDVEQQLTSRIDELAARRDMLHRLAGGDRALLPDRACTLLDRMPGLGYTADDVTTIREALVLVRALVPEGFDHYLAQIERGLDDPRYVSLIQRCWRAERLGTRRPPDRRTRRSPGRSLPYRSLAPARPDRTPGPRRRRDPLRTAHPPRRRPEAGLGPTGHVDRGASPLGGHRNRIPGSNRLSRTTRLPTGSFSDSSVLPLQGEDCFGD